ncbi:MAG: WYL domain-containing protein [Clostridia bacterium]|nr:WYL domain-containing protein [Clostridia bacterium]
MAKQQMQKTKLLELRDYFEKYTDEHHGVGVSDIIAHLTSCGISCERKAIYNDIDALISYGMDIVCQREGKSTKYFLASRTFETPELKMLVDAVSSSRFVTAKKTEALIKKLGTLCSDFDAKKLSRRVCLTERVKNANEIIYINIDSIHTAFDESRAVTFKYFKYNWEKKRVYGHNGALYEAVPITLVWNNENYYLVAYDRESEQVRHYRVDKMADVTPSGELTSEEVKLSREYDTSRYSKSVFDMFKGTPTRVELSVPSAFVDAMFDRFGADVTVRKADNDRYIFNVSVEPSPLFYAWVSRFEGEVRLVSPQSAVDGYRAHIEKLLESLEASDK